MHRAPQSIIRLGSTPVARRGVSPSASLGRSTSRAAAVAIQHASHGAAAGRHDVDRGVSLRGRRSTSAANSLAPPSARWWSSSSQSVSDETSSAPTASQPVEASVAVAALPSPPSKTLTPLSQTNGSSVPMATTPPLVVSSGDAIASGTPAPVRSSEHTQEHHNHNHYTKEPNQAKQPRSEEARGAGGRRNTGLSTRLSAEADRRPITHISGRPVPASTREAAEINAKARRNQQADEERPRGKFRFNTEAYKKMGRAARGLLEGGEAGGGGGGTRVAQAAAPPAVPPVDYSGKARVRPAWEVREGDEVAAAAEAEPTKVHWPTGSISAAVKGKERERPPWGLQNADEARAASSPSSIVAAGAGAGAGVGGADSGGVVKVRMRPAWEIHEDEEAAAAASEPTQPAWFTGATSAVKVDERPAGILRAQRGEGTVSVEAVDAAMAVAAAAPDDKRKMFFLPAKLPPAKVVPAAAELSYDERIEKLQQQLKHTNLAHIWKEIKRAELQGVEVTISTQSYRSLMKALTLSSDMMTVRTTTQLYDHMMKRGVEPDSDTYHDYMRACMVTGMGRRAVDLMHRLENCPTNKTPFRPSKVFMYNLILATCKESLVEEATAYYNISKQLEIEPSAKVLNSLMRLYTEVGREEQAVSVMEHILQSGFKPRDPHANQLAYKCVRKGDVNLLHAVLDGLSEGSVLEAQTVHNILYLANRKMDPELTMKIWTLAQNWSHEFSDQDYTLAVSAFINCRKDQMALATLCRAYKIGRKVCPRALEQVAEKLSLSNNRLDSAYYTLAALHENGESVPIEAINTVIAGSAMRPAMDRCFSTVDALVEVFGLTPNLYTYNSMMYALGGMRTMKRQQHTPLAAGMAMLDKMDRVGIKPNLDTFQRFIDLVCHTNGLNEATIDAAVKRMKDDYGMEISFNMMNTVAAAFHERGLYDLAQKWAQQIPGRRDYQGANDGHLLVSTGGGASANNRWGTGAAYAGNSRGGGGLSHSNNRPTTRGGNRGGQPIRGSLDVGRWADSGGGRGASGSGESWADSVEEAQRPGRGGV